MFYTMIYITYRINFRVMKIDSKVESEVKNYGKPNLFVNYVEWNFCMKTYLFHYRVK